MDENNKKVDLSKKPAEAKQKPVIAPSVQAQQPRDLKPNPTMPTQPTNQKPLPSTPPTAAEVAKNARANVAQANQANATNNTTASNTKPTPSLPPTKPTTPTPVAQTTNLETTQPEKVETLTPLRPEHSASLAQPLKPVSRWAFWKRAQQRDEQLVRISEGYVEMVDMVRSIRDQADAQYQNNLILRESLVHLPEAIQSLEGFGKSHEQVGYALEKINQQMETNLAKDERMANTMEGFNDTLKGMNGTTKATIQTFDRVQERMRDSDIRMENLFSNVRQSEEKVSDTMIRLQRNMSIFQAFFLLCLLSIIGGLIYLFINKDDFTAKPVEPAPVTQQTTEDSLPLATPDEGSPSSIVPGTSTEETLEKPATDEDLPADTPATEPEPEESNLKVPTNGDPVIGTPTEELTIQKPTVEAPTVEEPTQEPQINEPSTEESTR